MVLPSNMRGVRCQVGEWRVVPVLIADSERRNAKAQSCQGAKKGSEDQKGGGGVGEGFAEAGAAEAALAVAGELA